jgi:hypothetical protein
LIQIAIFKLGWQGGTNDGNGNNFRNTNPSIDG